MAFESLLNPVFSPLLNLPPFWSILIITLFISLIVTLIYKYTTDQNLMKRLKEELKEFQKEVKELKSNPEKAMKVQKRMMETNMKYMMHSFKPMIFTFIPIILIFGWLNAHMAYFPIPPNKEFTVTLFFGNGANGKVEIIVPQGINVINNKTQEIIDNKAVFRLKGLEGGYILEFKFNNRQFTKEVLITDKKEYKPVQEKIKDKELKTIEIGNEPIKPVKPIPLINKVPWINNFGWLGTYILFSILFSMILRKVLKIY